MEEINLQESVWTECDAGSFPAGGRIFDQCMGLVTTQHGEEFG